MPRAATALTPEFNEEVITLRGVEYRLRELSIGEYDGLVELATTKQTSPITGRDEEEVDNTALLKFMVLKCVIDPKLSAEKLAGLPMRAVLKLNQAVNRMHYGDEPEEAKKKDIAEDEDTEEEKEEPKGNG